MKGTGLELEFGKVDPAFFELEEKNNHRSHAVICEGFAFDHWEEAGLSRPLLRALQGLGFKQPTAVQKEAIPAVLSGRDVLGCSETGSGKTGAFLLPLIEGLVRDQRTGTLRGLIVLPTRELARQSLNMFQSFNVSTHLRAALAVGGTALADQEFGLRRGADILFGTPGRLVDLVHNSRGVGFEQVEVLILDEADRLLELGFKAEIEFLLKECSHSHRQTLLFSATLGKNVRELSQLALRNPLRVEPSINKNPIGLEHKVLRLGNLKSIRVREAALFVAIRELCFPPCLIFFKTRAQCHRATLQFRAMDENVNELLGTQTSEERRKALEEFRTQRGFLCATDLAARGLDFGDLGFVVNFELPVQADRYIHRAGRTARAGRKGTCLSLLDNKELKLLNKKMKKRKIKLQEVKVPVSAVREMKQRLELLELVIQTSRRQEKADEELERAEKEAIRAQNILRYSSEIMNRPRREWIISKSQRAKLISEDRPLSF